MEGTKIIVFLWPTLLLPKSFSDDPCTSGFLAAGDAEHLRVWRSLEGSAPSNPKP